MSNTLYGSLARIADFDTQPYSVVALPQSQWDSGDYVNGLVTGAPSDLYNIENCRGTMIPVHSGDHVIGAFGHREATLEGVGSWRDIRDNKMDALTTAGLFGAFTSVSRFLPKTISLNYCGHLMRDGQKVCMSDFAMTSDEVEFNVPTILLVGTSMSAGKTMTGRLVVQQLSALGLKIFGAKLTGAGRYRDILSFRDAGAVEIVDFVDAGLPTTVVPEATFRDAIRPLLHYITRQEPDFLVAEAGASPLEPYNGEAAINELRDNIRCTLLAASDPYAVLGVQQAFGLNPDLVTGPTTNTSAAINLVKKLTGVPALNILDPDSIPTFRQLLSRTLGVHFER